MHFCNKYCFAFSRAVKPKRENNRLSRDDNRQLIRDMDPPIWQKQLSSIPPATEQTAESLPAGTRVYLLRQINTHSASCVLCLCPPSSSAVSPSHSHRGRPQTYGVLAETLQSELDLQQTICLRSALYFASQPWAKVSSWRILLQCARWIILT